LVLVSITTTPASAATKGTRAWIDDLSSITTNSSTMPERSITHTQALRSETSMPIA
jgi:hypothetical protein